MKFSIEMWKSAFPLKVLDEVFATYGIKTAFAEGFDAYELD